MEAATEKKSIYIVYGGPTGDLRPPKSQKYQKPKAILKARKTETPNNVIFIPITIAGGFGSETRNGPSQRTLERLRCSS